MSFNWVPKVSARMAITTTLTSRSKTVLRSVRHESSEGPSGYAANAENVERSRGQSRLMNQSDDYRTAWPGSYFCCKERFLRAYALGRWPNEALQRIAAPWRTETKLKGSIWAARAEGRR